MFRRSGYLAIIAVLLASGSLPVAWAATSRIQQARVRRIKACVVRIPSMGEPQPSNGPNNPFPSNLPPDPDAILSETYGPCGPPVPSKPPWRWRSVAANQLLFHKLNQRTDVKPDGWDFYNPAAPTYSTREIAMRFITQAGIPIYPQGTPIKTSSTPYWEVVLTEANYNALAEMDVIYVPIARWDPTVCASSPPIPIPTYLTEGQRRLLTRLAESGVTIWVDYAIGNATVRGVLGGDEPPGSVNPLARRKNAFFTNLDGMTAGSAVAIDPYNLPVPVLHPLLSGPYVLQPGEAPNLGSSWNPSDARPSLGRVWETKAADMQPSCNFATVVPSNGVLPELGGYVVAGRFGAGYVVGTAGNVGSAINGGDMEDLKFGYNLCAWATEVTSQQKNGRHSGQSSVQVNGMIEQWSYPHLTQQAGGVWESYPPRAMASSNLPVNPVPPLIVDGVVISYNRWMSSSGLQNELNVMELRGENDFDNNAYVDDPITGSDVSTHPFADLSLGQSYDRIMGLPVTGTLFGMSLGEIPEIGTAQGAKAYVFAVGTNGVFSLPAPRPGLTPADYWNLPGVAKQAPNLPQPVQFTGAPGFAILPGAGGYTRAQVYAGGITGSALFGSAFNGKFVAYDVAPTGTMAPAWYYPPDQESNRLGLVSGPTVAARIIDEGTGAIDTMVLITSCSSGDTSGAQGRSGAGDTTGKVEGFIVATQSEVLTYPKATNQAGANNPNAGRRFVAARWVDIPPGQGQVPQARELMWDPLKHYEVRVMDKAQNYVLARYIPGIPGFNLLPDGTAGQVELPPPPDPFWALPGQANAWDLSKVVLLADYSVLSQPVDTAGQTIRPRFSPPTPYVRGPQQVVQPTGIGGGVAVGADNRVYYGTGIGYMCSVEWNRGRPQFAWKMRGLGVDYVPDSGRSNIVDPTNPMFLNDYGFVAAPAAGRRIVFASSGRSGNGTVYVMEPDATISFKLQPTVLDTMNGTFPLNAQKAQEVMVAADHGIGYNPNSPFIRSTQQPWGRVPNQFVVDPDTATVTFQNMENFSLDLSSVASPESLLALGVDTGGKPAVPIQWRFVNENNMSNRTAWVPLPVVAVYQAPTAERWLSGPVIAGDRVYLMGASGMMHEFPLDPKTVDPSFPRRRDNSNAVVVGLNGFNVGNTGLYPPIGLVKTRNISAGTGMPASIASPAIGDQFVAISSPRGLTTYGAPNVLVADSNRIIEATGDATAVASTDVVVKQRIGLSDFAIPTDPANSGIAAPILTERKFLSRPAVVRKLGRNGSLTSIFASADANVPPVDGPTGIQQAALADESYLAADTGNNRVVEFNPGGKVVGEWANFYDPFNLLPSGESLKLSGPMDVQRWVETERVGTGMSAVDIFVIHTLIADTGNTRVIELVDKIQYQAGNFTSGSFVTGLPGQVGGDGEPIRWYHVLVWSSQTNAQGLKLRYRTAQRVFWPDPSGSLITVPTTAATPRAASPSAPYLPDERFLSYTMSTVMGHTLSYPSQSLSASGYFQFHGSPSASVIDRIPTARAGGDSIVFLRGRYKVDETTATGPVPVTAASMAAVFGVRETKPGSPTADRYRFAQGVIDPNLPIITEIRDELVAGAPQGTNPTVHRLNGVASVQRTIRSDLKFAPETYGGTVPTRYPYFLIADVDGVWECRMRPGNPQFQLTMAFTNEDYAYVTGAGNGAPAQIYNTSGAMHTPGGRRFSAASARRLPNGLILIASRTPSNDQPPGGATNAFHHWRVGADVFLLRSSDYMTALERQAAGAAGPYDRIDVSFHGWQPDLWVQSQFGGVVPPRLQGAPSIRWRASEPPDPRAPPTLRTQFISPPAGNPNDLFGSYQPSQPNFADMVY